MMQKKTLNDVRVKLDNGDSFLCDVEFILCPALPEIRSTFLHPGYPAEPAEIEVVDIRRDGSSLVYPEKKIADAEMARLCDYLYEIYIGE